VSPASRPAFPSALLAPLTRPNLRGPPPGPGDPSAHRLARDAAPTPPTLVPRSPDQEFCDPYNQRCREPIYVWESKCGKCHGTGTVSSAAGHRSRALFSCPLCNGLGYLRLTSTDGPTASMAEDALERTINRPPSNLDPQKAAKLRRQAQKGRELLEQLERQAAERSRLSAEGARGRGGGAGASGRAGAGGAGWTASPASAGGGMGGLQPAGKRDDLQ